MKIIIFYLIFISLNFELIYGQTKIPNDVDSVAKKFLETHNPMSELEVKQNITDNDYHITCIESSKRNGRFDSVFEFGYNYSDIGKSYILIKDSNKSFTIVGDNNLEKDLNYLREYFTKVKCFSKRAILESYNYLIYNYR